MPINDTLNAACIIFCGYHSITIEKLMIFLASAFRILHTGRFWWHSRRLREVLGLQAASSCHPPVCAFVFVVSVVVVFVAVAVVFIVIVFNVIVFAVVVFVVVVFVVVVSVVVVFVVVVFVVVVFVVVVFIVVVFISV